MWKTKGVQGFLLFGRCVDSQTFSLCMAGACSCRFWELHYVSNFLFLKEKVTKRSKNLAGLSLFIFAEIVNRAFSPPRHVSFWQRNGGTTAKMCFVQTSLCLHQMDFRRPTRDASRNRQVKNNYTIISPTPTSTIFCSSERDVSI